MSLKSCKECGKQVSSNAKICPHCGAKLKMGLFLKFLISIFILFVIGTVMTPEKKDKDDENKYKDRYCRVSAEMFVQKTLKNPDSYKYVNFELYENKEKREEAEKQNPPAERKIRGTLTYRGTNSFNAVTTEQISFDFSLTTKDCTIIGIHK